MGAQDAGQPETEKQQMQAQWLDSGRAVLSQSAYDRTPAAASPLASTQLNASELTAVVQQLRTQHDGLAKHFSDDVASQGFLGRTLDSIKNNLGSSAQGHAWYSPSALWSHVANSETGSAAIAQQFAQEGAKLKELENAAQHNDLNAFEKTYREITGKDFNAQLSLTGTLRTADSARRYSESQSDGIETLTDTAAALTAIASTRLGFGGSAARRIGLASGTAFALGAATKLGLKALDGKYLDTNHDIITGGVMGLTVPFGELAGAATSRFIANKFAMASTCGLFECHIATQGTTFGVRALSAVAKGGVAGGIYGAAERPLRMSIDDLKYGRPITAMRLLGETAQGAGLGLLGGTALSFTTDAVTDGLTRTLTN